VANACKPCTGSSVRVRPTGATVALSQFLDDVTAVLQGVLPAQVELAEQVAVLAIAVVAADAGVEHSASHNSSS
jgi:hypothetical protein